MVVLLSIRHDAPAPSGAGCGKVVKKMKTYEIWITKNWSEIYEARTAREAIDQMRKETGFYYFWDIRIKK